MSSSPLQVTTKGCHSRGTNERIITTQPGVTVVDGTVIEGRLGIILLMSWSALSRSAVLPMATVEPMILPLWSTSTSAMGAVGLNPQPTQPPRDIDIDLGDTDGDRCALRGSTTLQATMAAWYWRATTTRHAHDHEAEYDCDHDLDASDCRGRVVGDCALDRGGSRSGTKIITSYPTESIFNI